MATVTTDFPTASVPRSRAERLTDGVIAGYIRALDGATARAGSLAPAERAILAADSAVDVAASHGHSGNTPQRAAGARSRGLRGGCSRHAKRLLEAR
jgi:hypothetical protein